MFWRFGFNSSSALETLLSKDDVALDEVLQESELLQECKGKTQKLVS